MSGMRMELVAERAGSTSTSPIVPLVAILVDWLPECCIEDDAKESPVLRQRAESKSMFHYPIV